MSFIFYFLAAVTIIGALGVVLSPNVVHSALFLVLSFVGVAAIYFYIGAEFLGAVQLMVYSGAVAVLIVSGGWFLLAGVLRSIRGEESAAAAA